VGFDNQLSAIERTVAAKERDFTELQLLSGDANYARETALCELEKVRAVYEDGRHKREKELREQHNAVSLRRMMLERVKHREQLRNDLLASKSTKPLSPEQELRNTQSMKSLMLEKLESRNKVNIFENAFRKIKEATGVSDVNEGEDSSHSHCCCLFVVSLLPLSLSLLLCIFIYIYIIISRAHTLSNCSNYE
jgi:coiled-coil domain-containing protein 151